MMRALLGYSSLVEDVPFHCTVHCYPTPWDLVRKSSCAEETASAIVLRTSCMSARVMYSTRCGEVGRRAEMARAIVVSAVLWYPACCSHCTTYYSLISTPCSFITAAVGWGEGILVDGCARSVRWMLFIRGRTYVRTYVPLQSHPLIERPNFDRGMRLCASHDIAPPHI